MSSLLAPAPLRGILLVVASTIFLASSDAAAKLLAASIPAIEIVWLRYLSFCLIMLPIVLIGGLQDVLRPRRPGLLVLRGFGLLVSALLFVSSLKYLPIAAATAIVFVAPVFVTALSVPFLGERVGPHRWAAALIGLIGVLVIVRPGTSAFDIAAVLPICSALVWAFTLILTRKMGGADGPVATLAFAAVIGLAATSIMVPFVWVPPTMQAVAMGAFVGLASTAGHWMVVLAYRQADASVLATFSYSQLVWASLLGVLLFDTLPDRWTIFGSALIVASGLYTGYRERKKHRQKSSDVNAP
jgi:drug/metabolite transporter (DMT)-like permease